MIWLAWRQQRTETLIAIAALALIAALLVPTGLHIASVYERDGIAACLDQPRGDCALAQDFSEQWRTLVGITNWFNLVPLLIGALLAAPFVLEFEHWTYRLSWTQSVTQRRWLFIRLGLIALGALAAGVLFTLLITWWRAPIDKVDARFSNAFEFEGLVPTAYTLYAAALVVALGVLLRRTSAAVGLALILFLATRIGVEAFGRRNYQPPIHTTWTNGPGPDLSNAWLITEQGGLRTADGSRPDPAAVAGCLTDVSTKSIDPGCLQAHGITSYFEAIYHPGNRFWLFQVIEAAIFTSLALALTAFAVWWIRRRFS